jgi:hypothetical protein
MKFMLAAASGWIGFCLADYAFYQGRLVATLPELLRAIATGFGF